MQVLRAAAVLGRGRGWRRRQRRRLRRRRQRRRRWRRRRRRTRRALLRASRARCRHAHQAVRQVCGRERDQEFGTRAGGSAGFAKGQAQARRTGTFLLTRCWKQKRMLPKSPGANSSRAPAARSHRGTRGCIRLATAGAMSGAKAGAPTEGAAARLCGGSCRSALEYRFIHNPNGTRYGRTFVTFWTAWRIGSAATARAVTGLGFGRT